LPCECLNQRCLWNGMGESRESSYGGNNGFHGYVASDTGTDNSLQYFGGTFEVDRNTPSIKGNDIIAGREQSCLNIKNLQNIYCYLGYERGNHH
jgi:hypothetical protein